jgi:indolepyruvate ferredoxin oxidoreductase
MAYKDEYEVARLHLDPAVRAELVATFGVGYTAKYRLHPPVLRAMGFDKKISLGTWFDGVFRALYFMRRFRGTVLDPFGHSKMRRIERRLPGEFLSTVAAALAFLPSDANRAYELVDLADLIRGYEQVKLNNLDEYRRRVEVALSGESQAGTASAR